MSASQFASFGCVGDDKLMIHSRDKGESVAGCMFCTHNTSVAASSVDVDKRQENVKTGCCTYRVWNKRETERNDASSVNAPNNRVGHDSLC